jgi:RNA polymerase sigma factor (sigma-70 family)
VPVHSVRWYVATDVGKERRLNEDFAVVRALPVGGSRRGEEVIVAIVADGMGGHAGGEIASIMAVDTVLEILRGDLAEGTVDATRLRAVLDDAIQQANARIHSTSLAEPDLSGMGTTLTVMVLWRSQMLIGHVGDSRAYLANDTTVEQLTEDHTVELDNPGNENAVYEAAWASLPSLEAEVLSRFPDEEILPALDALPEEFRAAVVLSDIHQFSYDEIARELDIPLGTVRSRIFRGRRRLRESLAEYARERHVL